MVDLLGNTAVDWFCILSYFRLDTLYNESSHGRSTMALSNSNCMLFDVKAGLGARINSILSRQLNVCSHSFLHTCRISLQRMTTNL